MKILNLSARYLEKKLKARSFNLSQLIRDDRWIISSSFEVNLSYISGVMAL